MRCFACGAEMRLEQVAKDDAIPVSGFERHTFVCSACGDIERRCVFSSNPGHHSSNPGHHDPVALPAAPPISPSATMEQEVDASSFFTRVFAKLYRVLNVMKRRKASHIPIPAQTVSEPIVPIAPDLIEPAALSTPPFLTPLQIEEDVDECEALLRHAIGMVRGQVRSPQRKTDLIETRPAAPAVIVPKLVAKSVKPVERKSPGITVEIYYDANRVKYVARDINSGLTVLRHKDSKWIKAMCSRMGWQVINAEAGSGV